MPRVGAFLDQDAVVAGDVLGDVAQQREVDGANAALQGDVVQVCMLART